MADLDAALTANRAAVDDFLATAEHARDNWNEPRAPGKWTPAQVTQHIIISYEESAKEVREEPSRFPSLPFFLTPVTRRFFFQKVLKEGGINRKAKTLKPFDPPSGPATPEEARARIDAAVASFEEACRACEQNGGTFKSKMFGSISVTDYARFEELHTRHHAKQIPTA